MSLITSVAVVSQPGAGGVAVEARVGAERPATGDLPADVVAARAIIRPSAVAVADDGSLFVAEASYARVYRVAPDGRRTVLPLDLRSPLGLAVGPDGTLFVADTDRIVTLDPSGRQGAIEVPGAQALGSVGIDGSGARYATDPIARTVFRVAADGTTSQLDFAGVTGPLGIDVTLDGTVSVIDATTRNVVRRAADGTLSTVGFTGLRGPRSLDVEGDRIAVADSGDGVEPAHVVLREADGTQVNVLDVATPGQVVLQADGTVITADAGVTGCRCPEPAGRVVRAAPGGELTSVDIGDTVEVGPVAAAGPSTVLFASWPGARGYIDPNPVRRVVGAGPAEDVSIPDGRVVGVDVAPDGTAYLSVVPEGSFKPVRLLRRSPDGERLDEVPLPHSSTTPLLTGVSVDQDGRLFVSLGTGYGTGPFEIVEPLASGGEKTWYRSPEGSSAELEAMAAGAGKVLVVVSGLDAPDTTKLQTVSPDGTLADVRPLPPGDFMGMDVDAAGNVYLAVTRRTPLAATPISVVTSGGATGTITYAGMGTARAVSIGADGTLYVADSLLGVVAIADVGALAAADDDGSATPAVPVPGQAGFTG